ncbi:hypothetical protein CONLIGDRAFT_690063 [Coniochaeta ligniaria NRRL 30616]|uniref:Uncharacterized protein n=1 Tax=Coniochaeta ligniaria NRRL 30616 TaxID=1408157 RepID=A0A1J7J7V5_9PEZI|nr:hypothetical protein CONLIGDRAFT_690063 [Coniochaeta ligniaria NRRL 30616]
MHTRGTTRSLRCRMLSAEEAHYINHRAASRDTPSRCLLALASRLSLSSQFALGTSVLLSSLIPNSNSNSTCTKHTYHSIRTTSQASPTLPPRHPTPDTHAQNGPKQQIMPAHRPAGPPLPARRVVDRDIVSPPPPRCEQRTRCSRRRTGAVYPAHERGRGPGTGTGTSHKSRRTAEEICAAG